MCNKWPQESLLENCFHKKAKCCYTEKKRFGAGLKRLTFQDKLKTLILESCHFYHHHLYLQILPSSLCKGAEFIKRMSSKFFLIPACIIFNFLFILEVDYL